MVAKPRTRDTVALASLTAFVKMGLLAFACCACGVGTSSTQAKDRPPPPRVTVHTMVMRAAELSSTFVGVAEAVSSVQIRPRIAGLLRKQVARDGARVAKGDTLFLLDAAPYRAELAAARAALAQAVASGEWAARDHDRKVALGRMAVVSQQEIDTSHTSDRVAASGVQAALARVRLADLQVAYATIRSPITGVLGEAGFREGSLVTAYETLLGTVYATDPINVVFAVSEVEYRGLQQALGPVLDSKPTPQDFRITLADGTEVANTATLDFVAPALDPDTGTLSIRIQVPNPSMNLRPGQSVRVQPPSKRLDSVLLIPQRAVRERQGKTYVFVLRRDATVEDRAVSLGARIGPEWLVEAGLAPGERIVVDGTQKLRANMTAVPEAESDENDLANGG